MKMLQLLCVSMNNLVASNFNSVKIQCNTTFYVGLAAWCKAIVTQGTNTNWDK